MKRALFIGRFQPFHNGHLSAVTAMDSDIDEVIIGVGSDQYSDTEDNPFSFMEREKMIKKVLDKELKKPYQIISVPDIHDEKNWVKHVVNIVPDFEVVYTGNDWVKRLFNEAGRETRPVEEDIDISGTDLRKMIKEGDEKWKQYIPEEIIEDIK